MVCGNCKKDHETVAEVRSCYGEAATPVIHSDKATDKQIKYVNALRTERGMKAYPASFVLNKQAVSNEIRELLRTPKLPDPGRQSADGNPEGYGDPQVIFTDGEDFTVSVGARETNPQCAIWKIPTTPGYSKSYYAIPSISGMNDLDFFMVQRPTEGKWAGYTFVKAVVGGKTSFPVKGKERLNKIITAIEEDPEAAAHKYGQEMGRCDRCNTHLTDAVSRAHSRGPNCRDKYGPGFAARVSAA